MNSGTLLASHDPARHQHLDIRFRQALASLQLARRIIADAVAGEGAAVNAASLAELCVGYAEPGTVADRIRSWGVEVLDIPTAAAEPCARAYLAYRRRHKADSGKDSPSLPLPDFFIGAHAQIMGWTLATADKSRYLNYFPKVQLKTL